MTPGRGAGGAAVTVREQGSAVRVVIVGELDLTNVGSIRPILEHALAKYPHRVVFDLSGLEFIDSSGIRLLLWVARRVTDVDVLRPTPAVRRLLEITAIEPPLRIID